MQSHGHRLPTPTAMGLKRAAEGKVIGGVAGGVAARLGVDVLLARLAFLVLATAGFAGAAVYAGLWVWLPAESAERPMVRREVSARHALALAMIVGGLLLLLRATGVWLSDSLTWSVALGAAGSGLVWTRAAEAERTVWRRSLAKAVGERALPDARSIGPIRWVLGACLVVAGAATFFLSSNILGGGLTALTDVVIASAVTLVGVALVIGPWLQRLGGQVAQERRQRIRSEERAEMAAHLHDSVLQTLALIQRADSREEISRLARGQERELRSWLFGRHPEDSATRLGQAVQDLAGRVEDRFGVVVDVVLAGDVGLDDDLTALVEAAGEAMVNAAKHSGGDRVDVFVEVEQDTVTVFIRDEGTGFDPTVVGTDRRGLSHSITDRMHRHGGKAMIVSQPGEGTEVELRLPLTVTPENLQ
ncbi:MAG: ATP-binding protein [Euzebya sp.]